MPPIPSIAAACLALGAIHAAAGTPCRAESGPQRIPVIELYTSEGCSSCPPADRWLSTLKPSSAAGRAVVQAFHVGYWDALGWVDRFASPAHTQRQRQLAAQNGLSNIYTPQVVRDGRDWRDLSRALEGSEAARARILLQQTGNDAFEALVTPSESGAPWSAYWTVTEHGHSSKVKAGENAGEWLQHDFVVRQYVPAGRYRGDALVTLKALPAQAAHPRRVNLVVTDPASGRPLQALGLAC